MLEAMTAKLCRALGWLLALCSLPGCDLQRFTATPSDPLMSKEAIATREAPAERVFQGRLAGEPTFLVLHDCEVYRVERREEGGTFRSVDGRTWKKR